MLGVGSQRNPSTPSIFPQCILHLCWTLPCLSVPRQAGVQQVLLWSAPSYGLQHAPLCLHHWCPDLCSHAWTHPPSLPVLQPLQSLIQWPILASFLPAEFKCSVWHLPRLCQWGWCGGGQWDVSSSSFSESSLFSGLFSEETLLCTASSSCRSVAGPWAAEEVWQGRNLTFTKSYSASVSSTKAGGCARTLSSRRRRLSDSGLSEHLVQPCSHPVPCMLGVWEWCTVVAASSRWCLCSHTAKGSLYPFWAAAPAVLFPRVIMAIIVF